MKQRLYQMLAPGHRNEALEQIERLEHQLPSARSRFAVPFLFKGKGLFRTIKPRQNPVEIESLFTAVCELAPERVLEIGTARGGTLYLWAQAARADATLVSVDLPGGDFGGAYPPERVPFYAKFARPEQTLHLIRDDSHTAATKAQVEERFGDTPIDFAFIDGDHTYDGVKADFNDYGPLVRPGGIIAFHDTLPRPDMPSIQVDKFWNEVRERYNGEDLVGPESSGRRIGIGMMRVPEGGVEPFA